MALKFLRYTGILAIVCMTVFACKKEDALVVSPTGTNVLYSLPQGNHPYDTTIMQFYKDYTSLILYKFDSVDYNYNITGAVMPGLNIVPGDTSVIPEALDYLQANLFNVYPKSFLVQTMPFAILLASNIYVNYTMYLYGTYYYSVMAGTRTLAFGLVNDSLHTLTGAQLDSTRGLLNMAYWQLAISNGTVACPSGFDSLTTYAGKGTVIAANPAQYGILPPSLSQLLFLQAAASLDAENDFLGYIDVITSTDSLTMQNTWLSSSVDVKGMYKKKYDLVRNYCLQSYGVDLQALGNIKNK